MPGLDQMGAGGAGQPPLPPSATPAPTFQGLQGNAPQGAPTPGGSQISGALTRLAMEIDQALKLLAQAAPQLSGWVDQTTQQLRQQVGMALSSGVSSSPASDQNRNFPGGGSNL